VLLPLINPFTTGSMFTYLGLAAPEFADSVINSSTADVFSFGITLIHIVTNK
jgi:hypothetical protein